MLVQEPALNYSGSLWARTAPDLPPNPSLMDEIEADVVVVGAGLTGLRAAIALAVAGSRVVVVDAGDVGWGASGRSGGQVNPALPFVGPDKLRRIVGDTYAGRMVKAAVGSADEIFDLVRKYQINCDARQKGWLRVNHCRKAARISRADAESWSRYGAQMLPVGGEELQRLSGTTAYDSGILNPGGGAVQPLGFVRGLAKVAMGAGARIFGRTEIIRLERKDGKWLAHAKTGHIRSDWVVLATNAYSGSVQPKLGKSIIPLVSIQIATDTLSEKQIGAILPEGHTISDTRRIIMYARREPGNRLVFGGLGRIAQGGVIKGHGWLMRDAERIYPQLKGVNWKYKWGGKIALTGDRLPHLHEPEPGLIVGLGYNGRGVAISQVMGRTLAERVLGAHPESLPFPIANISSVPFRGIQMLGKGTAIWWMKFLDRLEVKTR